VWAKTELRRQGYPDSGPGSGDDCQLPVGFCFGNWLRVGKTHELTITCQQDKPVYEGMSDRPGVGTLCRSGAGHRARRYTSNQEQRLSRLSFDWRSQSGSRHSKESRRSAQRRSYNVCYKAMLQSTYYCLYAVEKYM